MTMHLECASESSCVFSTTAQSGKGPPQQDRQVLDSVRPAGNLAQAGNALRYAIEQRLRTLENPEFAEPMALLRPVLAGNPKIDRCWDLNYLEREYLLACTLSNAPGLYLFASLMANCGEGFCRYIIYPLSRVK